MWHLPRRWVMSCSTVAVLATGGLVLAGGDAGARSSTVTLHLFAKSQIASLTDANGQAASAPAANDEYISTDLDYVGTHAHHAKNWTASDHEFCIFPTAAAATCFGQFAVGGSMIYADKFTLTQSSNGTVAITGGTGQFAGATGTVSMKQVGTTSNSDVTIVVHKP
jgi:hypothetical protein